MSKTLKPETISMVEQVVAEWRRLHKEHRALYKELRALDTKSKTYNRDEKRLDRRIDAITERLCELKRTVERALFR